MATSLIGNIEHFDAKTDDWNEYIERVEQFYIANDITDDTKKVALLLTIIGSETYGLLRNILFPDKPSTKTFEALTKTLKLHLNPKPIVIAERYKFYERNQKESESLSEYIANLRKLTEHCQFGPFLNDALRDKFVCGMRSQISRRKLLAEHNLTLDKAIDISSAIEEANKQAKIIYKDEVKVQENDEKVFQTSSYQKRDEIQRKYTPQQRRYCYRCNDPNHLANTCKFRNIICNRLWYQGTFKSCLQQKRKKISQKQ